MCFSLVFVASLLTGCHRDPQVVKQKDLAKATDYFQKGKYREAIIEDQNALQVDSQFAPAHYQLAQSYMKISDWPGAYQELMRTVTIDPANSNAQLDLIDLLLAGGKYLDARGRAEDLLKADPQNIKAQLALSEADAGAGDMSKALNEAQSGVQMDTSHAASYLNLALLEEKNNDAAGAQANFEKALSLDPKSMQGTPLLANFTNARKIGRQRRMSFNMLSIWIRTILLPVPRLPAAISPRGRKTPPSKFCGRRKQISRAILPPIGCWATFIGPWRTG